MTGTHRVHCLQLCLLSCPACSYAIAPAALHECGLPPWLLAGLHPTAMPGISLVCSRLVPRPAGFGVHVVGWCFNLFSEVRNFGNHLHHSCIVMVALIVRHLVLNAPRRWECSVLHSGLPAGPLPPRGSHVGTQWYATGSGCSSQPCHLPSQASNALCATCHRHGFSVSDGRKYAMMIYLLHQFACSSRGIPRKFALCLCSQPVRASSVQAPKGGDYFTWQRPQCAAASRSKIGSGVHDYS